MLALLTSPGREEVLAETLGSFERMVSPKPSEFLAYCDGNRVGPPIMYDGRPWIVDTASSQGGFCRAS